jgi:glycosyltransferase involved in cell wall biosynthesis
MSRPAVLISAYACSPSEGSEKGAGWNWVVSAGRIADVIAIVREAERQTIVEFGVPSGVEFVFIDLPHWVRWLKPFDPGSRFYYCLWQFRVGTKANQLLRGQHFDVLHHLTWASMMLPVGLMRTRHQSIVIGPVGGGVGLPRQYFRAMSTRSLVYEFARAINQVAHKFSPLLWHLRRRAAVIIAQNVETARYLAVPLKTVVRTNAGIPRDSILEAKLTAGHPAQGGPAKPLRLVYLGRLVEWKGLGFALTALADPLLSHAHLEVIGDGPARNRLTRLANRLGVRDRVHFRGHVPHTEVNQYLDDSDVVVFPSLHEEGAPFALVESLARGLRIVCVDIGGPALTAGNAGVSVSSAGGPHGIPREIAMAIPIALATSPEIALKAAAKYSWESLDGFLRYIYARAQQVPLGRPFDQNDDSAHGARSAQDEDDQL